jgi:4-amino-4-deoxy-L-arabinose transferase-like glycosyltransferase
MQGYAYIGRLLMAMADTATIYLVFLLGRRLYGTWAGLLAAAFSAFSVLQIQLAHFFAVDPVSTTFTLLALYGALRMYDRRGTGAALLTGLGIGLAVASKYSALPIATAPLVAASLSVACPAGGTRTARRQALESLLIAWGFSLAVFAVTSPFVFLDWQNFWQAVVKEQGDMVSGIADFHAPVSGHARLPVTSAAIEWGLVGRWGCWPAPGWSGSWCEPSWSRQPRQWVLLSWVILCFGPPASSGQVYALWCRWCPCSCCLARGWSQRADQQISRPASPRWDQQITDHASRLRFTLHASRFTLHASRLISSSS